MPEVVTNYLQGFAPQIVFFLVIWGNVHLCCIYLPEVPDIFCVYLGARIFHSANVDWVSKWSLTWNSDEGRAGVAGQLSRVEGRK